MTSLTPLLGLKGSNKTWYPVSVEILDQHLAFHIKENTHYSSEVTKPLRRNIAYGLQYIEFQERIIKDINMSSVVWTQSIKSFILHGASVIEALLHFTVVSSGNGAVTHLKSINKFKSNTYSIGKETYIQETEIYQKMSAPEELPMVFDQLCKKVENKKLLGATPDLYPEISKIRKLRNKIHIQGVEHSLDTDWWSFNRNEYDLMKSVLHGLLTSPLFKGSSDMSKFDYLK